MKLNIKFPIFIFILIIISSLLYATVKSNNNIEKDSVDVKLSDFQISACKAADLGNTCDTKLSELDIVTKQQCCTMLNKCCG